MDKEARVALRLSAPLRRMLDREANEQGISLSEHMRRLLLASRPHMLVFEEIGKIQDAAKPAGGLDYVPFLVNMARRLQEGLQALESFEAMAAQWRQDAQRELTAALADVQTRIEQGKVFVEMAHIYQKLEEGQDERRDDR